MEVSGELSCTMTMTKRVAGWCYCTKAQANEMSLSSLKSRLSGMVQREREFRKSGQVKRVDRASAQLCYG